MGEVFYFECPEIGYWANQNGSDCVFLTTQTHEGADVFGEAVAGHVALAVAHRADHRLRLG